MRRLSRRAAGGLLFAGVLAGCKRRDPVRVRETEEGPAILESVVHMADPKTDVQLIKGFHEVEQNSWRWTAGKFSVTLKAPPGAQEKGATLVARFTLPDPVIAKVKTTTLTAAAGGTQLGMATYSTAGEYNFTAAVPAALLAGNAVTVDFALSNYLSAGSVDARELGVIASSIGLEPK